MPRTPFAETETLLALLEDDEDEAERLLLGMYPNELTALINVAGRLVDMAKSARRIRARELEAGHDRVTAGSDHQEA